MIDTIINFVVNLQWNSRLAIALYWVPFSFCLYGYTVRTFKRYIVDRKIRETPGAIYIPKEKIGTLLGRALVTITPIANLWAAMFDLAPKMFSSLFSVIEKIFDQPLVPDTKYHHDIRKDKNNKEKINVSNFS